jgi:hypothetical protein
VRRSTWVITALLAAATLAGCGSDSSRYANRDRPASPVTVSGSIGADAVRISPGQVGAGPLTILMANLTDRQQRLTFQTAGQGAGIRSTATIPAQGTGEMQVDAGRGSYELSVRGGGVRAASLSVRAPRPSAQDQLLEP